MKGLMCGLSLFTSTYVGAKDHNIDVDFRGRTVVSRERGEGVSGNRIFRRFRPPFLLDTYFCG